MTRVEQLKDRLIEMIDSGLTNWHFSTGPKWHSMSIEEKADAILQMWDAPKEDVPPRSMRKPMHIEALVKEASRKP